MTSFSALTESGRFALAGFWFLIAAAQLALCLYRYFWKNNLKACIGDAVLFGAAVCVLTAVTVGAQMPAAYWQKIPWIAVLVGSLPVLTHSIAGMFRIYRQGKKTLSPTAVKEALDNLNAGVCFADQTDRIILINRKMGELVAVRLGSYPQTLAEVQNTANMRISPTICTFSDGSVWRFQTVPLREETLKGFTQTTAQDITELYKSNKRLENDNKALEELNVKMQKMYDRLADRIREEETLHLKMRIHDDIGTSLIAISEILRGGTQGDMEAQLAVLQNAVRYFAGEIPAAPGTFADAQKKAADMNVSLILNGYLPPDENTEGVLVAAVRECVTNCIHHARGDEVTVTITERTDLYTVRITNNGEVPKEKIREGGGLTALRKRVETAGGEMYISHSPRVALILNLPRKEQKL